MRITIVSDKALLGKKAAACGVQAMRAAIARNGKARIIVATGASQFEMLEQLVRADIAWHAVTAFHLDEYVGMPLTHPASFRLYLWKRFVSRLPLPLAAFHYINAEKQPQGECTRLAALIAAAPIDVCFAGIGENGHLAFNDPPADFTTTAPYLVVKLDDACRRQQMGEGWFKTLHDVPTRAISMSIRQIMRAKRIVCTVPDARKAQAVHDCLTGAVTPMHPASILQRHRDCHLFLDKASAALLPKR
jgi:glucosamine-6-phosphate deaminase